MLYCAQLSAGGWTKKKGSGFIKLNQFFTISDEFFLLNGDRSPLNTNSLFITSLYGEYGLTDRLTISGYLPIYTRNILNESRSLTTGEVLTEGQELDGIGDAFVSFKYGFFQGEDDPIKISVGLEFGLAFGSSSIDSLNQLQIGDGEYNQKLFVEASHSFYPVPLYVSALVGINNRTNDFSEEFHFAFESGYSWNQKFTTTLRFALVESFQNGASDIESSGSGIFANNIEFTTLRPGLNYKFTNNFGIDLGAIFILEGQQTLADPGYEVGLFYEF